jgi:hypothetical protein
VRGRVLDVRADGNLACVTGADANGLRGRTSRQPAELSLAVDELND